MPPSSESRELIMGTLSVKLFTLFNLAVNLFLSPIQDSGYDVHGLGPAYLES